MHRSFQKRLSRPLKPVHRHTGVLQVDRIRKKRSSLLRSRFEVPVVISAADHPMLEGLVSKPSIERQDLLYVVPGVHKVAGMNQDVPVRQALNSVVETMRIGNYYKAHRIHSPYRIGLQTP